MVKRLYIETSASQIKDVTHAEEVYNILLEKVSGIKTIESEFTYVNRNKMAKFQFPISGRIEIPSKSKLSKIVGVKVGKIITK